MSREYAMSRVRDALEKSEGNHLKAQRLLMSWLEKDHSLLLGLVTPHLPSIVTHAINYSGQPAGKSAPAAALRIFKQANLAPPYWKVCKAAATKAALALVKHLRQVR